MTASAADYIAQCQSKLNRLLQDYAAAHSPPDAALTNLNQASHYCLTNGGKRVRPVLVYAAAEAIQANTDTGALDSLACAVEFIHTYSLVHDDLPAMDDDDLRRGQPSVHRAYDEATAILVGDGLQANAFGLVADAPGLSDRQRITAVKVLAAASGPAGMVGGQFMDIQATDTQLDLAQLQAMHNLKTGALIRAAVALGGIAANAVEQQLKALDVFGQKIGLAFQVKDDILDVEGNTETLGKTSGKDKQANKPTYVQLLGLDGARQEAQRLIDAALQSLQCFDEGADNLRGVTLYIIDRNR